MMPLPNRPSDHKFLKFDIFIETLQIVLIRCALFRCQCRTKEYLDNYLL